MQVRFVEFLDSKDYVCLFQGWDGYRSLPQFPLFLTDVSVFAEHGIVIGCGVSGRIVPYNAAEVVQRAKSTKLCTFDFSSCLQLKA